jgi:hypothetical protein
MQKKAYEATMHTGIGGKKINHIPGLLYHILVSAVYRHLLLMDNSKL